MGKGTVYEKQSCQWLVNKCRLLASDVCSACAELGRFHKDHFRKHGIQNKGVCHRLYPANQAWENDKEQQSSSTVDGTSVDSPQKVLPSSSSLRQPQEQSPPTLPPRGQQTSIQSPPQRSPPFKRVALQDRSANTIPRSPLVHRSPLRCRRPRACATEVRLGTATTAAASTTTTTTRRAGEAATSTHRQTAPIRTTSTRRRGGGHGDEESTASKEATSTSTRRRKTASCSMKENMMARKRASLGCKQKMRQQARLSSRERKQTERFIGGPANGVKMAKDRVVPYHIRMLRAAKISSVYYEAHPEKRNSRYDLSVIRGLVGASGHPLSRAFLPLHGQSKAARSRRRKLHQQTADGLARMLGGDDPGKEKDEIIEDIMQQSNKTAGALLPIGKFGYHVLTTDAGDSGSVGEVDEDDVDVDAAELVSTTTSRDKKNAEKISKLMQDVGCALEHIKSLSSNKERRPFLAAYHSHPRKALESVFGKPISHREFNNIQVHAKYPGAFQPVKEVESCRCKVDPVHLRNLCKLLDSSDSTQKYAYGTQILALFSGTVTTEIGRVDRMKKAKHLASDYIIACNDEARVIATDMSIPDTLD
jgi:hypothetical protein